ncbi:hypothetical protein JCM9140_1389 [Halalkalibacter wakoensis JCM 9140]|uniref:DUF4083 domain-containing protein n=1 Tax=Halalkalibacter wakoensis JCM 9140 TaxID=1236970 RepID=W4Q076_9BACI|nr:DUF4083 domain-containing protein [Halalkalibacter wakoensis]GAE25397.1 hypothetical protein JCM9140_1389 [Halalkalibacter wakoensis JCM 9140]
MDVAWGSVIYQLVTFGLIILFAVSFTLFIRRLLVNSASKQRQNKEIGEKLDRIIELLEEEKNQGK